jgi:predicted DNA-binding transcriptional regulator AlpA
MARNGRQPDLVGTREASEILGVEKPRIGRYIKRGRMPEPVCELGATKVWLRQDVEALRNAITARQQGRPEMRVVPSKPIDLVGTKEVADMLGVERTRIGRWLKAGRMPVPLARLHATPVWFRKDIAPLAEQVHADRAGRVTARTEREAAA